jgi:hypothetical protein
MDEMCGADGRPGNTVTRRETALAAENTESPFWDAVREQVPTEIKVMRPVFDCEHTLVPDVTAILTERPLELEASGMNPGCPSS